MAFTIDRCEHFDGDKCTKCGRIMPDRCKDQEELEDKARKYDLMVATQEAPGHTDLMVSPEAIDEALEAEQVVVTKSRKPPVKRKG